MLIFNIIILFIVFIFLQRLFEYRAYISLLCKKDVNIVWDGDNTTQEEGDLEKLKTLNSTLDYYCNRFQSV